MMMMITTSYDLHKLCCKSANLYAVVSDDDDSDDDTICRWDDVM